MKKDVALVIACVLVTVLCCLLSMPKPDRYTVEGTIYKVDYEENTTVIVDERGHAWGLHGTEVPIVGTKILMTMDGHNNNWIVDDEIIDFKVL